MADGEVDPDAGTSEELFSLSFNDDREETVVLLHGLLSSHLEFQHIIPRLSDYHLIAVDLCGHSRSSLVMPPSISSNARRVAQVIQKEAHGGEAHIVGLSMGGFVALELGLRFPDLCKSLFVTGAAPFEGTVKWMAERPAIIWWFQRLLIEWLPARLYWMTTDWMGMKRHEELLEEMRRNLCWDTVKTVYTTILDLGWDDVASLRIKTLTCAGGLQDDVAATKKMGEMLSSPGSRAVVVKNAVHAWDLQFPDLFAQGIASWIRGDPLPGGFEDL